MDKRYTELQNNGRHGIVIMLNYGNVYREF
jgi:hypothetical protein